MRFALVNNERAEAKPDLQGLCPVCSQPIIAKCGNQRIHHWAHRNNKTCDSWWESETEWHRSWKNNFPADCQEVLFTDAQTGEKHIADIRTSHGLVIEFQHSHIDSQERTSREKFYHNMVWVVDGTRLKNDYKRFLKGARMYFKPTNTKEFFFIDLPGECFPAAWLESSVPVIFDFRSSTSPTEPHDATRDILWCLLPERVEKYAVVVAISYKDFVSKTINGSTLFPIGKIVICGTLADKIYITWNEEKKEQQQPKIYQRAYDKWRGIPRVDRIRQR